MPNTRGRRAHTPEEQPAHGELWDALTLLAQVMANQANQGAQAPHALTLASRVRDFMRMNPPEFNSSKVNEDPQEFIDEVYKVLSIMGVRLEEKLRKGRSNEAKRVLFRESSKVKRVADSIKAKGLLMLLIGVCQ